MNGECRTDDRAAIRPLLSEADFAALLGIGERKVKELRAAGVIGAPLELSPRVARWTHEDYLETLRRLPRREKRAEPETLAEGRRRRIEKLKAGAGGERQ